MHTTFIRNGQSACDEKGLSNLAIAFLSGSGVVGTNDYLVTAQLTPDNTVKIGTGRVYIPTTDGTMTYGAYLDATQNVTISPNNSGVVRTDAVVVYFDLSVSPNSGATNVAKFYDVLGPTDGSALPPTNAQILAAIGSNNPYLVLSWVTCANGFVSINSGNLTDKRTYAAFNTGQFLNIPLYIQFTDLLADPSAPASGYSRLYGHQGGLFLRTLTQISQIGDGTLYPNGNSGTSATVDWSNGRIQSFTMNGNCAFTFTNPALGKLVLVMTEDVVGSRVPSWPVNVKWPYGVVPTLGTANKIDIIGFLYDGTNYLGLSSLSY